MRLARIYHHLHAFMLKLFYASTNFEVVTFEVLQIKKTSDGKSVLMNGRSKGKVGHQVVTLRSYLNMRVCVGGLITVIYIKGKEPVGAEVLSSTDGHTAFDWLDCSYHHAPSVIREHGKLYLRDGTVSLELSESEYNRYTPKGCYLIPYGDNELKLITS